MYEIPFNNSSYYDDEKFAKNHISSNEADGIYVSYGNQNIDHYYNLENLPRPINFECEVCNKGFFTHNQYRKHINEHVECPFPECGLKASEKFIDQHITHTHMLVNFDALIIDNETWIAERKKRFVTIERAEHRREQQKEILKKFKLAKDKKKFPIKREKQNDSEHKNRKGDTETVVVDNGAWVSERKIKHPCTQKEFRTASEIERSKRGERLKKENLRFPKRERRNRNSKFNKRRIFDDDEEENKEIKNTFEEDSSDSEVRYGIPAFKGTKAFYESLGELSLFGSKSISSADEKQLELNISDDDLDICNEPSTKPKNQHFALHNALGSLMGAYGSDSEVDETENIPKEQIPDAPVTEANHVKLKETTLDHDSCDNSSFKVNSLKRKRKHGKRLFKENDEPNLKLKRSKACNTKFPNKYRRRTLLEKLLEPQIIHERNVILQCIRYIVDNNFFDSESK